MAVTFIIVLLCYIAAVTVKDIGSVISIAGATVNPFIGFLFPIIFYLRLDYIHNKDDLSCSRILDIIFAVFAAIVILAICVAGFN